MKTILIPTDFSATAKNAAHYAAELALVNKSNLILLYIYQMPVIMSEVPVIVPSLYEIEADCMNELEKIKKYLHQKYSEDLKIDCACKSGFVADEIHRYAEENNIDMIVMGMQGAGLMTEKIMGSNTTALMQKAKSPVLAIDNHVKFKLPEHILLACDYESLDDKSILKPLKDLTKLFKARLHILNVVPALEKEATITKAVEGLKLKHYFEEVNHEFHFIENDDVIDGINRYVKKNDIDLIAMIPREHSFIKNLFKEPHTKQMAFHTHLPLLTLHE